MGFTPGTSVFTLYTPSQRYWKQLFVPGSVSVSEIKRQLRKVVPKRVPDILKSVNFVSGYPKCRLYINTISCHIKVNSDTIELSLRTSCFCILDLLFVFKNCLLGSSILFPFHLNQMWHKKLS